MSISARNTFWKISRQELTLVLGEIKLCVARDKSALKWNSSKCLKYLYNIHLSFLHGRLSLVDTHAMLWKSLNQQEQFKTLIKRFGFVTKMTSSRVG